jgi:hypothetical protein
MKKEAPKDEATSGSRWVEKTAWWRAEDHVDDASTPRVQGEK